MYEDLKVYFGNDGHYLLFVDDANRLSQLDPLLQLLHDQRKNRQIKVILTVRDYALPVVRKTAREYSSKVELYLSPLKNEEIREIIEAEFGIRNHHYLDRICKIAKGNPRLAVMAAMLAKETNKFESISDASNLYDEYFSSITADFSELETAKLLQIGGILAFFGSLDRTAELFKQVAKSFGFSETELWQGLERLHASELVDVYDTEVAKISDQVLGTYLIYAAFFKLESSDFSVLLSDYLARYEYKFREALYTILDIFNHQFVLQRLQKHIDVKWKAANEDESQLLRLMRVFWFVKKTEILVYLKDKIDSLPATKVDVARLTFEPASQGLPKDQYLEVLEAFQYAAGEDFRIALELILAYLEKQPSLLSYVLYLLLERFSFDVDSYDRAYRTQRELIDVLIEKSTHPETGLLHQRLLLRIAQNYLKTQFRSHRTEGLNLLIQEFQLVPSPELFQLRRSLWEFIAKASQEPATRELALQAIRDHATRFHDTPVNKPTNQIVKADSEVLLPSLSSTLDPSSYADVVVLQQYLHFIKQHKVAIDNKLQKRFTNETYRLSKILLPEWSIDFDKRRTNAIKKEVADYSYRDYLKFLDRCIEIQKHIKRDVEAYQLISAIEKVLVNLSETDVRVFRKLIRHLLQTGNQLGHIYPTAIAKLRLSYSGPRYAYNLLKQYEYNFKESWLLAFLSQLGPEQVNGFYLNELYVLYQTADLRLFTDFDFLESYRRIDDNVFVNTVKIVFDRSQPGQLANFHYLFNPHTNVCKTLKNLFAENVELLEEVYLHQSAIDQLVNYRGLVLKKIVELDPAFLTKYLQWLYGEQNYVSDPMDGARYIALWTLDNYQTVIAEAVEFVFEKEKSDYARSFNYVNAFFRQDDESFGSECKPTVTERMETFISEYIQTHHQDRQRMIFIFDVITECFPAKRLHFLKLFLLLNQDYETFERLAIQPNSWGGEGSLVPVFEKKIEFLESILPLVSSVKFLKHKLHINNLILEWKERVELENKKQFLGYF